MLTVNELAAAVGVAPQTARNWLSRHEIPKQRSGGRILVPRSAIRAYRECQRRMHAKPLTAADVPPALSHALRRQVKRVGDCRVWTGKTDINGYGTFVYSVTSSTGPHGFSPVGRWRPESASARPAATLRVWSTWRRPRGASRAGIISKEA